MLTGSAGLVGRAVLQDLCAAGHRVVEYDLAEGLDLLDLPTLRRSIRGCDAVVHCAAESVQVNVQGTWNVLLAAAEAGVRRVVHLSTVDVLGVFKGERRPDYLPLDNDHPCRPNSAYGRSKRIAEEICALAVRAGAPAVVCLRPPGVWTAETYEGIRRARAERPSYEWDPFWEYGAFIDVRDLARACRAATTCPAGGFRAVLVSAPDLTTSGRNARDWAEHLHPDVEWRGGDEYDADPFRTLLDIDPARRFLGWEPRHTWLRLRPAETEDAEFAHATRRGALREHFDTWDEAEERRRLERCFTDYDPRIVSLGGEDVGVVALAHESDHVRLLQLFLLPEYRNHGLGRSCLARIAGPIRLRVLRRNAGAQRFFTRLGFEPVGETETHYLLRRG